MKTLRLLMVLAMLVGAMGMTTACSSSKAGGCGGACPSSCKGCSPDRNCCEGCRQGTGCTCPR